MKAPLRSTLGLGLCALLLGAAIPQENAKPDFWRVVERAVAKQKLDTDFARVLEHLHGVPERRAKVAHRLSRVDQCLRQPWLPPALAADLKDRLQRPLTHASGTPFPSLVSPVAHWLDMDNYAGPDRVADLEYLTKTWQRLQNPDTRGADLLQLLSTFVEEAHLQLQAAHGELTPEQRSLLFEEHLDFFEAWLDRHRPNQRMGAESTQALRDFSSLFAELKSDREHILAVTECLLGLSNPTFMKSLAQRLGKFQDPSASEEYGPDVLAVEGDTDWNRVVLMGKGKSTQDFTAALTIDLGGDDTYENAAVADSEDMLVNIVLDLGGDDLYESSDPGPVFSAGGVAILVDRKGSDTYQSERAGLASSILGFAALIDLEGNDTYTSEDYSQGHSTCGVALLYDSSGDDSYSAHAHAQGGGIGHGLCALVDGGGNDSYLSDLHWPDVYGDSGPDVYHGASQGYSTGIRSTVVGGVAALLDLGEGTDRYQAGSFSQGGGYYFGFGLMFDGGGDDEAHGSRYAQGFGVHQAVGVKWDAGGNDLYKCRSVAHTGMAWDEGVGYLLDDAGDDIYRVGDLGCGGAAQTGIAICIDGGGADQYSTGKESQGGTGSAEYHSVPSIGVLIDLGGETDSYSLEERGDNLLRATVGLQIFLDDKAKRMSKALKSKLLR
ncbi:MAG: hypothetical protein P1V35_07630 [Planctomycetota bacterium]|nr:hypothetical protein [Planctomycetota bacterium]